jgi:hypothetical protein
MCRVALEIPRRTATSAATLLGRQALRPIIRNQQLNRIDAFKFRQQVFPALDFLNGEIATGDVQNGQAEQTFITQYGGDQVIATLIRAAPRRSRCLG